MLTFENAWQEADALRASLEQMRCAKLEAVEGEERAVADKLDSESRLHQLWEDMGRERRAREREKEEREREREEWERERGEARLASRGGATTGGLLQW